MNKNLVFLFFIANLLYISCSKVNKSDSSPQNTVAPPAKTDTSTVKTDTVPIKVQLVSGGGQTDTIGKPLVNPIIVKVTRNGMPVSGYSVQFQASGCNQDNIISTLSQPDGTADYIWS